jgi:hypothetical protein
MHKVPAVNPQLIYCIPWHKNNSLIFPASWRISAKLFTLNYCYRPRKTGRIKQVMVNEFKIVVYVLHICCRFKPTIGGNWSMGKE